MLERLEIENIVLIKRAELDFDSGLCVITGETGSGKSIVLSSIMLLLGKKMKTDNIVGQFSNRGIVTGVFQVEKQGLVVDFLSESGIIVDGESIIISRIIENSKIKSYINSRQVPSQIISELGEKLAEVNRQHEQTFIMNEANHIDILDGFANTSHLLGEIKVVYQKLVSVRKDIEQVQMEVDAAKQNEEFLHNAIADFKKAKIEENEEERLVNQKLDMQKSVKIHESLQAARSKFESAKIGQTLTQVQKILVTFDEADEISKIADQICSDSERISDIIEALLSKSIFSERDIEQIDDRIYFIRELARKYRVRPNELPELFITMQEQLQSLVVSDEKMASLRTLEAKTAAEYSILATKLSTIRKEKSIILAESINQKFSQLEMPHAEIQINFSVLPNGRQNGIDDVSIRIRTNSGHAFGQMGKIASGGELSRIVLAIKGVTAFIKSAGCIIFDEIDSGISGKTSEAVGQNLKELGASLQVLVVTHQPQVASKSTCHFLVEKGIDDAGLAFSKVEKLTGDRRKYEIARLLSGSIVTPEAMMNANAMIGNQ